MIRLAMLSLALLATAAAGAAKPVKSTRVPVAFQGDWALDSRNCAPGPVDSGNMRITARTIINFESKGKVERVTILDPQTIRVESRVTYTDTSFGNIEMMSLSTDKKRLTIGEHSDISVYTRCAK
jgi:hypothetical protein